MSQGLFSVLRESGIEEEEKIEVTGEDRYNLRGDGSIGNMSTGERVALKKSSDVPSYLKKKRE